MNNKYYEEIYELFKVYHPETEKAVEDWRPVSNIGIRLTTKDGAKYDFDKLSKGLRKVQEGYRLEKDEINDELCRKSFAYHLSEQMVKGGYNQQTLAEHTGISIGAINSYLRQSKTPSLTNVRKIAYVLNCSVSELID